MAAVTVTVRNGSFKTELYAGNYNNMCNLRLYHTYNVISAGKY